MDNLNNVSHTGALNFANREVLSLDNFFENDQVKALSKPLTPTSISLRNVKVMRDGPISYPGPYKLTQSQAIDAYNGELSGAYTFFMDSDFCRLFSSRRNIHFSSELLSEIDLSETAIGDRTVEHLKSMPSLKKVILQTNQPICDVNHVAKQLRYHGIEVVGPTAPESYPVGSRISPGPEVVDFTGMTVREGFSNFLHSSQVGKLTEHRQPQAISLRGVKIEKTVHMDFNQHLIFGDEDFVSFFGGNHNHFDCLLACDLEEIDVSETAVGLESAKIMANLKKLKRVILQDMKLDSAVVEEMVRILNEANIDVVTKTIDLNALMQREIGGRRKVCA